MNNVLHVVQNHGVLLPADDEDQRNSYTSLKKHMDSPLLYDMECIKTEYHFSSSKQLTDWRSKSTPHDHEGSGGTPSMPALYFLPLWQKKNMISQTGEKNLFF